MRVMPKTVGESGSTGKAMRESSLLPRFVVVWVLVALAALAAASTLQASNTVPDGYVPTATFTFTPSNTPTCVPTPTAIGGGVYEKRINAGGDVYTDTLGNVWQADVRYAPCGSPYGWTTGQATSVSNPITNTANATLYQSQRYANGFTYRFLLPNGDYVVTLGFAETYVTGPHQRVFSVGINGVTLIPALDVFSAAGGAFLAYDRALTATVTTGQMSIDFAAADGAAFVSSVHVLQIAPPTPTPTATPTATQTGTVTWTSTPVPSATATRTATASGTASTTPTRTFTATSTASATPTATSTATASATPTPPPLDPYEPNDSYVQATHLSPGVALDAYIQSPDDADYYYVDVTSGPAYILARLTNLPADFDLFVDDSSGARLGASTQRGLNDEALAVRVLQAGRYYVRVVGFDHTWSALQAYYLTVNLSPPAPAPVGGDAYEPNNTIAQAYLLPGSGVYTATIDVPTDVDFYALDVAAPNANLNMRLSNLPADYDLLLFQGDDQTAFPVGHSQNRGLVDEVINLQPAAGRYYIEVLGFDRSYGASPYTLIVNLSAATPTATPMVTPSVTPTATQSRTASPTLTATSTKSPTPTTSPTASVTPTSSSTPPATATAGDTETPTATPSGTVPIRLFLPVIVS